MYTQKFDYNPAKSYGIANNTNLNLTNAQSSLLTNYNQATTGLTVSVSEPLRHLWALKGVVRVGAFVLADAVFDYDVQRQYAKRVPVAGVPVGRGGAEPAERHYHVSDYAELLALEPRPRGRPAWRQGLQHRAAGGGCRRQCEVRIADRLVSSVLPDEAAEGEPRGPQCARLPHTVRAHGRLRRRVCSSERASTSTAAASRNCAGSAMRSASPYTVYPDQGSCSTCPTRMERWFPRDPANPRLKCADHRCRSTGWLPVGSDTSFTANLEYGIPLFNQVTFAFAPDFNMTFGPAARVGCGRCVAGQSLTSSSCGRLPDVHRRRRALADSRWALPSELERCPVRTRVRTRMSNSAELQVILPIINAPFRIYYAYNPLRLYKDLPQALAVPNTGARVILFPESYFPNSGARPVTATRGDPVV